jgi:hypothetical protein
LAGEFCHPIPKFRGHENQWDEKNSHDN